MQRKKKNQDVLDKQLSVMNPKANATILLGYVDDISVFVCSTILCPTDQFHCLSHQ